ncbi:phage tail protein [Sorangium sp. So ce216]
MARTSPFGAYNFLVNLNGPNSPDSPLGGFSDVSGLMTELTVAEYRNGNDVEMHVRKVPGIHKVGDVTLKRGIISSRDLWTWIEDARLRGVNAQRQVVITLNDESGNKVQSWTLRGCVPLKYTGPTLAAKGGEVALEELTLSAEGIVLDES